MGRINKEFQQRMEGMVACLTMVKKIGIEETEKEIVKRGFLKADIAISPADIDRLLEFVQTNIYATMLSTVLMTLYKEFDFGKKRIKRFKETFDNLAKATLNYDWLGQHYTSFEDYTVWLNEMYNLGLDTNKAAMCQFSIDKKSPEFGMADMDHLLKELEENGFKDAADFLKEKLN